jgi:flagellar hook-length control protein FliK
VNATPPIAAAGTAHAASHLPAADSSLADFLLADSPANAGQDFRSIAATFFAAADSIGDPVQAPGKNSVAGKKSPPGLPKDESEPRDSKDAADAASAATAHPELTVPLLPLPAPPIQTSPRPEPEAGTLGLKDAAESTRPQINSDQIAAKLAAGAASSVLKTPQAIVPPTSGSQSEVPEPATNERAGPEELQSGLAGSQLPSLQPTAVQDGIKLVNDALPQIVHTPASGAPAKKPSGYRSESAASGVLAKPVAAQTTNTEKPTLSPDVAGAASSAQSPPPAATDAVPVTPPVEPASVASAKQAIASPIAGKAVPHSDQAAPNSKTTSGRSPASSSLKNKDRDSKDIRASAAKNDKAEPPVGRIAATPGNSGPGNNKDGSGFNLSAHSGGHPKAEVLKQAAGGASSATALADGDGPDEVPASAASPVTTAKLVQGMSQSEFRVGMQTEEFGSIDIRTSVARHMFSAQISVEHSDGAKSLAAELPALYHRLADQQVSVGNIVIQGQSLATSSGLAQDAQAQSWRPQSQGSMKLNSEAGLPAITEVMNDSGRLDIRI